MSKNTPPSSAPDQDVHHDHDDDLIVTPKGQSRLQFMLTMALLLFVLIIFSVGPYFQSALTGGGGAEDVYFGWTDPQTSETHEFGYQEFITTKRALGNLTYFGLYRPPSFVDNPSARQNVSDEDTAMFLVQEQLAANLGLQVTDREVGGRLRAAFGSAEQVQSFASRVSTTARQLQESLRRSMLVDKYKSSMEMAFAIADPAEVEKRWGEQHPQYSFEYVQVDGEDFLDAAREKTPDDATLEAWLAQRPRFEQQPYFTEDRIQAQVAWVPLEAGWDATALLEAFPPAEDVDPEVEARNYYNTVMHIRFQGEGPKPGSETTEEGGDDTEAADEPWTREYDDVAELCATEAPLRVALQAWLDDMVTRTTAGETVDFLAEAGQYGLSIEQSDTPRTKAEMEAVDGWGGSFIANRLSFSMPGSILTQVVTEEDAFVLAKPTQKLPGELKPFAEIRADVAEDWAKQNALDLAVEALQAVHTALAETEEAVAAAPELPEGEEPALPIVSAETFRGVVTAAGFEVSSRPWLERFDIPNDDYDNASPGDMHIRVTAGLFELEEGQVAKAAKNSQKTHAVLVRYVGTRPAPVDDMSPRDLMSLRQQVIRDELTSFQDRYMSADSDDVRRRYAMTLASWDSRSGDDDGSDATEGTGENDG